MVSQTQLLSTNASKGTSSVTVVMEMFNFQQQPLLDAYQADQISLDELSNKYKGTEGFALEHYGYILEVAKKLGVKLVAGFVPKLQRDARPKVEKAVEGVCWIQRCQQM